MSRIVSVWLPRWPVLRYLAAQAKISRPPAPVDPERPFVLTVEGAGGLRVACANPAAEALGLRAGDSLADARAKAGTLQIRAADAGADDIALRRLALWATRYAPIVALFDEESGADGLFLDIAGAAHFFGGEAGLLADLAQQLARFCLPGRCAVADTAGASWALSRFSPRAVTVLPSGQEADALAPLPIDALRLDAPMRRALRRLGFKTVGALIDRPRQPFAARFAAKLLRRLDQALGRAPEPLASIVAPPAYHGLARLIEPVGTQDAVLASAARLMRDLVPALERDGAGARTLRLSLYRVDGEVTIIEIGLALPGRDPTHVARLLALKLERTEGGLDAGFGFEAIGLTVTAAEPMTARQTRIGVDDADRRERCAALIDGLRQRLGPSSVRRLGPKASHMPEQAEASCDTMDDPPAWPAPDGARPRPLLLLCNGEPAQVTASVPEGPPRRFSWRGATHGVVFAQGPERIAAEWWRHHRPVPTRDYYMVEDEAGRRFWLYREGLYGREPDTPRWFMHGLFA